MNILKNRKSIIFIVLMLVSVFAAYRLGAAQVKVSVEQKVFTTVQSPTTTPTPMSAVDTIAVPNIMNTSTLFPTPTSIPTVDQRWEKFKGKARDGLTLKEAKKGEIYGIKELVSSDKKILIALEGCDKRYTEILSYRGKYFFVADVDIVNISQDDYMSCLSDYTLMDAEQYYSYNPSDVFRGRGDINGIVKSENMKRAEIAFEVPYDPENRTQYTLIFKSQPHDIRFFPYKK